MLFLATRNLHKVAELRAILGNSFEYKTLADFPNAPLVIEDAPTFSANATKKAVELAQWLSRLPEISAARVQDAYVLADDSGLEVDALGGAPGVHSARFASLDSPGASAGNSSDGANNEKLLQLLAQVAEEKRTARFRCVLALTPLPLDQPENASPVCLANEAELATTLFEGVCEGRIAFTPTGTNGFGYDPLFLPNGFELSFAQLGDTQKNQIRHRARALGKLKGYLVNQSGRSAHQNR